MKNQKKGAALPLAMVLAGTVAMLLRRQLYLTAVDAKGLLRQGTPLEILLLALTGTVFAILFLALKNDRGSNVYEDNYSQGVEEYGGSIKIIFSSEGLFAYRRDAAITLSPTDLP